MINEHRDNVVSSFQEESFQVGLGIISVTFEGDYVDRNYNTISQLFDLKYVILVLKEYKSHVVVYF